MSSFSKSPWIIHYDASSCNGCDIETLACLTPLFDVERLGVVNTGNPKHADIFLVTGAVNEQSRDVICNIYHQLPEPKVVVAVGTCAASGGIFRECYNIAGGVDSVIPVDVYVPGARRVLKPSSTAWSRPWECSSASIGSCPRTRTASIKSCTSARTRAMLRRSWLCRRSRIKAKRRYTATTVCRRSSKPWRNWSGISAPI